MLGNLVGLQVAYQVLECTPEMTDSQIKAAYRQKCLQFHPDKLSSYKLDPAFTEFANSQQVRFNAAYEQICDARSSIINV